MSDYATLGDEKSQLYSRFKVFQTHIDKNRNKIERYFRQLSKLSPQRFREELLMKTRQDRPFGDIKDLTNIRSYDDPTNTNSFWEELCLYCDEDFLERCVDDIQLRKFIKWGYICHNKNISDYAVLKYRIKSQTSDGQLRKPLKINPCSRLQLLFYQLVAKLFGDTNENTMEKKKDKDTLDISLRSERLVLQ